ncbi:MAG: hypothetical protein KME30_01010 [Iphinoe sp. HA4291-MV1]|nr:hypothetical protein [Iphinoe sp. HA4291-MV1]
MSIKGRYLNEFLLENHAGFKKEFHFAIAIDVLIPQKSLFINLPSNSMIDTAVAR